MKAFFITGTDTDCGKTYVTCKLFEALKQAGKTVEAIKPVASGCKLENTQWVSEDALKLQQHSQLSLDLINPWSYQSPVSPHIAAREEGREVSATAILDYCMQPSFKALDYLLVEGAGGLLVPLNEEESWLDFLLASQMPVILVVGMRLGCLNHALLTEAVLKQYQLPCVGWVANCLDKEMLALEQNIDTLTKRLSCPHIATIPYSGDLGSTDFFTRLNGS